MRMTAGELAKWYVAKVDEAHAYVDSMQGKEAHVAVDGILLALIGAAVTCIAQPNPQTLAGLRGVYEEAKNAKFHGSEEEATKEFAYALLEIQTCCKFLMEGKGHGYNEA